jgi:hypothetical protein
MLFRLKNTGATYQEAIQACFKRQLNKNVEAYMDDVVVKTRNSDTLIADLEETFASLREYRWKLNPNKCVFGVPSGKLLGFIISHRGIEALETWRTGATLLQTTQASREVRVDSRSRASSRSAPRKKEQLLLYLAATTHVVISAIVVERQEDGHAYPI